MATVNQFNRAFVNTPLGYSITDPEAYPINPDSHAAQLWLEYMETLLESTEDLTDE